MLNAAYRGLALAAIAALALLSGIGCSSKHTVILATTTSTQDSGLLDVLKPQFEKQTDYKLKVIAVGTGQALEMGANGDADVLLVHAPSSEKTFMDDGNGVNRQLVMHNDFIIVGPSSDPAHVASAKSALDAMKAIADSQSPFISRGDDSGTNKFELSLWKALNIDPSGQSWYEQSGQGMGATLQVANQKNAYTISDLDLIIVYEGDPKLLNVYHVIEVNPDKFSKINTKGAQAFSAFMLSAGTQKTIGEFGVEQYGQQLFIPDAGKSEADVGLQ